MNSTRSAVPPPASAPPAPEDAALDEVAPDALWRGADVQPESARRAAASSAGEAFGADMARSLQADREPRNRDRPVDFTSHPSAARVCLGERATEATSPRQSPSPHHRQELRCVMRVHRAFI